MTSTIAALSFGGDWVIHDKNSIKILNQISINIDKLNFTETQSYRRNTLDLNCDYHHKVFYHSNIIPKFCFSCFKIQIRQVPSPKGKIQLTVRVKNF